jgi:hypothetical protein
MKKLALGVGVAACLAIAGCSHSTGGNPSPTPSASASASSPTSTGAASGAPQVASPLDATKYLQNPCGLLTPAQALAVANFTSTRPSTGAAGPVCNWSDDNLNSVAVGLIQGNGLADVYRAHQVDSTSAFQVVPSVSGYPAVITSDSASQSQGSCTLGVGLSNTVVMTLTTFFNSTSSATNPCPVAQKAAQQAITTVKGD